MCREFKMVYLLDLCAGGPEELDVSGADVLLVLSQRLVRVLLLVEEDEGVAGGAAIRLADEEHAVLLVEDVARERVLLGDGLLLVAAGAVRPVSLEELNLTRIKRAFALEKAIEIKLNCLFLSHHLLRGTIVGKASHPDDNLAAARQKGLRLLVVPYNVKNISGVRKLSHGQSARGRGEGQRRDGEVRAHGQARRRGERRRVGKEGRTPRRGYVNTVHFSLWSLFSMSGIKVFSSLWSLCSRETWER